MSMNRGRVSRNTFVSTSHSHIHLYRFSFASHSNDVRMRPSRILLQCYEDCHVPRLPIARSGATPRVRFSPPPTCASTIPLPSSMSLRQQSLAPGQDHCVSIRVVLATRASSRHHVECERGQSGDPTWSAKRFSTPSPTRLAMNDSSPLSPPSPRLLHCSRVPASPTSSATATTTRTSMAQRT